MAILLYEVAGAGDIRPSPYCWRTRWALAHKGLDFDIRPLAYTQIATIGDGSHRRVPVIEHDGFVIADSFAIALYLEATFPDRPSLFGSARGIDYARFLNDWTETAIHDPSFAWVVHDMFSRLQPRDQAYFRASREGFLGRSLEAAQDGREAGLPAFRAGLQPLRIRITASPFLGGEAPDYADYVVASAFRWLATVSDFHVLAEDDAIGGWLDRLKTLRG